MRVVRTNASFPRRTLLALPFLPAAAHACTQAASLAITLIENYPIVQATIAGQPVSLLLDTGAQGMLVTPEAARNLQLPLRGMTRIYGTGGSQEAPLVLLPGLRLADTPMPNQVAPVAPLPIAIQTSPPLAGLLGASLLSQFDLDLDVPRRQLTLSLPDTCAPPFPGATLPLEVSRAGEAFIPVRINGQPFLALIDTGSRATLLTTATARHLNIDAPISANTARGVDGERLPLGHVQVRLSLGDDPATPAPVSIAPLQLDRGDLLLGLDILGRQRLWIAYARGQAIIATPAKSAPAP